MEIQAPTKSAKKSDFILDLIPGKIIDLQINMPVVVRLKLALVGYDIGNYLILKYPQRAKASDYADVLTVGNIAIVRYIVEGAKGECVAFATTIKSISQVPEKFIFLEYPKQVENRQLRNQQRLQTNLPAQIGLVIKDSNASQTTLSGIIVDISAKGCQFIFKAKSADTQVKKCAIVVVINLLNEPEPVKLMAIVRNSRYQRGKVSVGIQFDNKDERRIENLIHTLSIDLL